MQVSLEPPRLLAGDGLDDDLFARPARLQDLNLEDGREVLTRDDQTKSLHDRLMRLWAERGDFSKVTEDSIKNPTAVETDKDADATAEDKDGRPAVEDVRKLQETMLHSLALVRGELTTALDLLSVLSTPTDPPDVDVNSIPLPQQTLTLVPTAAPPRASSDPAKNPLAVLPVASSLTALKHSANAFFRASEELIPLEAAEQAALAASAPSLARPRAQTRAPDPWPTILRLHASSPRRLVPLGAGPGATLTGKGETRAARQVGVVYGCPEAREDFRRAAVARVGDLVEQVEAARKDGAKAEPPRGRTLVLELESKTNRASWCWSEDDDSRLDENRAVERILQDRARSALGEELFAQLVQESRADPTLRAELVLGEASTGDKVRMQGTGWTLSISMTRKPPSAASSNTNSSQDLATLGSLLRLLLLQTYSHRRSPQITLPARPLLATLSAVLNHQQRTRAVSAILDRQLVRVQTTALPVELVNDGKAESALAQSAHAALSPAIVTLGGRATLRIGPTHVYHVTHSYPLPGSKTAASAVPGYGATGPGLTEPSLTLRLPGKQPIAVPSLRLLEQLLSEQVSLVIAASGTAVAEGDAMQS